jgi:DNA-binding transcriptional LysR family regulator
MQRKTVLLTPRVLLFAMYESERMLAVLPIELPGLVRPVGVMWSRQRPLSPAAQALIESLEATVRRLMPAPGERRVSTRRRYSGESPLQMNE